MKREGAGACLIFQHPDNDTPWVTIAQVQLRTGHRTEALAAFRTAVEPNPASKTQLPLDPGLAELKIDPESLAILRN